MFQQSHCTVLLTLNVDHGTSPATVSWGSKELGKGALDDEQRSALRQAIERFLPEASDHVLFDQAKSQKDLYLELLTVL